MVPSGQGGGWINRREYLPVVLVFISARKGSRNSVLAPCRIVSLRFHWEKPRVRCAGLHLQPQRLRRRRLILSVKSVWSTKRVPSQLDTHNETPVMNTHKPSLARLLKAHGIRGVHSSQGQPVLGHHATIPLASLWSQGRPPSWLSGAELCSHPQ